MKLLTIVVSSAILASNLLTVELARAQQGNRVVVIPLWSEGATWTGAWEDSKYYKRSDIVEDGGSSYIAVTNHTSTLSSIPPSSEWELVAASGSRGETGETGAVGDKGDKGDKGDVGDTGPVGPKGDKGDKGDTGEVLVYEGRGSILVGVEIDPNTSDETNTVSFNVNNMPVIPNSKLPSIDLHQPSLAVNCVIALQGIFPSRNSISNPTIGEIMYVGFNFTPRSWAPCNGQLLPIASNQALFSLIGTIYGGDGRTTLGLPDMRGRVPVHYGSGPGLPRRNIGQKFGRVTE